LNDKPDRANDAIGPEGEVENRLRELTVIWLPVTRAYRFSQPSAMRQKGYEKAQQ
jgi:hypothetical protein